MIFKIETWINKKTGQTVYLFHDIHTKNYEGFIASFYPHLLTTMRNTIRKADNDTNNTLNQCNDIINYAKQRDAKIIVEGPYVDEPNKRSKVTEKHFNDLLLRKLYKQAIADNMNVENIEVRSCFDSPLETVLMKYNLDDPSIKTQYWQEKLPIILPLSEEIDVSLVKTAKNYATAHEKYRKTLNNFDDGPVAHQYYRETLEKKENNFFHQLIMNFVAKKQQPMNNTTSAQTTQSVEKISLLQKKSILARQTIEVQNANIFATKIISNGTDSYGSIETNIIHTIINDKEHNSIFVLSGGLHCNNIADPLIKLGYKKTKTTKRTFNNNPLPNAILGLNSQGIPIHIKEHFETIQTKENASYLILFLDSIVNTFQPMLKKILRLYK